MTETPIDMTQFKTEGQPAFPVENKEKDNSATPSVDEKTNTDQTQSQNGEKASAENKNGSDTNFADHPRWKERESDWTKRFNEQESRHLTEIETIRKELEGIKGSGTNPEKTDGTSQIPAWFNGDESQWREFESWNKSLVASVAEESRIKGEKEVKAKSEAEKKAIEDATTYMNETVSAIESDKTLNPQGEKIDKNKLFKFVLDNDLVDSQGRWNYKAGYLLMKSQTTAKTNDNKDRKEIAGAIIGDKNTETKAPNFSTSSDFKKPGTRPW